ncbi:MAG: 2-oxoacid:acceptor oxidoreductase family protein, partial [Pseudomonadota bacterium]
MLYNSSLVDPAAIRGDIEVLGIPITELATNLGSVKVGNMLMLGAFIRVSNLISFERIVKNLPELLGKGKAPMLKANREALQLGFDYVKEQKQC